MAAGHWAPMDVSRNLKTAGGDGSTGDAFVLQVAIDSTLSSMDYAKAEDSVHSSGDKGVMALAVRKDTAAGVAADGDYHPLEVDASGRLHVAPLPAGSAVIGAAYDAGPSQTTVIGVSGAPVISADLTTRTAVTSAPTSGQKLVAVDIIVSVGSTGMSVLFEEETSNDDKLKIFLPANGTVQITPRGKLKLAVADKKLMATASVAGDIAITVIHYSEA